MQRVAGVDPDGLGGSPVRQPLVPRQVPPCGPGSRRETDQGMRRISKQSGGLFARLMRDAGPLRIPARPSTSQVRGLGDQHEEDTQDLQRVGPPAVQRAPEAPGKGEAAGRPSGGGRAERCPGHGFWP